MNAAVHLCPTSHHKMTASQTAELALRAEREKTKLLTDLLQGRASA